MIWVVIILIWLLVGTVLAIGTGLFIHSVNRRWDEALDAKRKARMIDSKIIFPGIIIFLSIGAAIVCAWQGDWRRAVYWTAAAVLNVSVTI